MITLIFSGMTLLIFTFVVLWTRPTASQKTAERRLMEISRSNLAASGSNVDLGVVAAPGSKGQFGALLLRYRFGQHLSTLIMHAGSDTSVPSVLGLSAGLAPLAGIIAHIWVSALPPVAAAIVAGGAFPYAKLRFQRSRRLKALNNVLPDTIDLMARALRAGHSMSSAIEVIAAQSPEPIASEFQQVAQQQKLGMAFRDSVIQLSDRIPSKDLHFLVTAILVQKETGGDLTEILDRTVAVIRERIRIDGEIKTYTAQGRLTGWILAMLPIAMLLLINIINPGYTKFFFDDPLGQKLLYGGAGLIGVGTLIIRSIVNIEV
jgi:tight adherence protein B